MSQSRPKSKMSCRGPRMRPPRWLLAQCVLALAVMSLSVMPLSSVALAASGAQQESSERRLVVIADIHGALAEFRQILIESRLLDEQDRWVGGNAQLVQTGDFLDRGADALAVAALLRKLQDEAPESGGQVIVLLGNHETLNLTMDLRDVTPEIVSPLASRRSAKRIKRYCSDALAIAKKRAWASNQEIDSGAWRSACLAETPEGMLEYIEALGPKGDLGRWIRSLPAMVQIGDWVFLHGGLSPALAGKDADWINGEVVSELGEFDRMRGWLLQRKMIAATSDLAEIRAVALGLHDAAKSAGIDIVQPSLEELEHFLKVKQWWLIRTDGPFWFRGYSSWTDAEAEAELPAILEPLQARHIVVGHTPRKSRTIESRFGDRVFLLDTGMLTSVYGGQPSALEILGPRVTAIYPGGREILLPITP